MLNDFPIRPTLTTIFRLLKLASTSRRLGNGPANTKNARSSSIPRFAFPFHFPSLRTRTATPQLFTHSAQKLVGHQRFWQADVARDSRGFLSNGLRVGVASETRVIINLSDQRASLVQQGRITLVSPIASGKPGWSTPTGNFRIFNNDIDHRSRSFGLVVDAY
jgi:L,D-transpeptidase catalytic domain